MKIDIVPNDGSPMGVTLKTLQGDDPFQPGVGGSELALLTLCELWHKRGDQVRLFNTPRIRDGSPFEQLPLDAFDARDKRDVCITFRSPNVRTYGAQGLRVWWSCDSHTVNDYAGFAKTVDKVVTISPSHTQYFRNQYGIGNAIDIDLPVRVWEYSSPVAKVPKRCIFTSVPDRGIVELMQCWPRIHRSVPEASLVCTSDYRLWGCKEARNYHILHFFLEDNNAKNMGAIRRSDLVREELQAELFIYPCTFHEMFCYACAEAELSGAFPITSDAGSLPTTNMGMVIKGDPKTSEWREKFTDRIIDLLTNPNLTQYQIEIRRKALERFNPERILQEWDTKVFNG